MPASEGCLHPGKKDVKPSSDASAGTFDYLMVLSGVGARFQRDQPLGHLEEREPVKIRVKPCLLDPCQGVYGCFPIRT